MTARAPASLRVLHVSQPSTGGCAKYVVDLARDHAARGYEVVVATPPTGWLGNRLEEADVAVLPWPAVRRPGLSLPAEMATLRRIVIRARPDIVHLHSAKAGLAGRLMRIHAPVVFQPHGWSFYAVAGAMAQVAIRWERYAARRARALVCVSDEERRLGREAGIEGNFVVIPNGVDLREFTPASAAERHETRARLRLPERPIVVCVGRVSEAKGQDVLLRAWPAVRERVPDALLILVGEGTEDLAGANDESVIAVGAQGTSAPWLAAADVVAVPSRWEGMSLVVLEAMARGRPIVATDAAGNSEAVGAEAGAIVPVEAEGALAAALVQRLVDAERCAAEGAAAARRARRYDLRTTLEAMAALYEEHVTALSARRDGALLRAGVGRAERP